MKGRRKGKVVEEKNLSGNSMKLNKEEKQMTPEKLNANLIAAMREKIPEGANLANILMEILSIGKEAVYRRFRGEVPFTLTESVLICQKLGISLDKLAGAPFGGGTLFDLNLFHRDNPIDTYYAAIDNYVHILKGIDPNSFIEMLDATNRLSLLFYLEYENLAKFHLFKWLYQHNAISLKEGTETFDKLVIPSGLLNKEKEFLNIMKQYKKSTYIWDNVVFQAIINDISFFKQINLLSEEKMLLIKQELLNFMDEMEITAEKGEFKSGSKVEIYISKINFETSYTCLETQNQKLSFVKVYNLHTINSRDEVMFENMKRWILSLKKFSVLITQSAEIERYQFFKKQKEYINAL